ncbi:MAG: SWIB/MDM2 domain-containing protein [Planctomycetota bacterium]
MSTQEEPDKKKKKPNPALMKPVQPDEVLAVVVGSDPLPRSEITKKLWDYIKGKDLQNPENRREIIADDALRAVFGGKDKVTMFEMTKLVSAHILPAK